MTEPLSPVAIEQAIRDVANRIGKGVSICAERYSAFLTADREFDRAYANAYLAVEGAEHIRKQTATLKTLAERQDRDVADAAYRYADRQARALEAELRAYQSVGASVREQYRVAGRGES